MIVAFMNNFAPNRRLKQSLVLIVAAVLVSVPFYAFYTIGLSSLTGHYTLWRLSDEFLLMVGAAVVLYLVLIDKKLRQELKRQPLFWLIGGYVLLSIVLGVVALLDHEVTKKALGYGLIVNLRFLVFFVIGLIAALESSWLKRYWQKLLLIPAAAVVAFGLLQYFVLPQDFLSHFGYGRQTIQAYETINNNRHYLRIMSSLRGANPLGAYLVIIVSALSVLGLKSRQFKDRIGYSVFWLGALAALYFSGSRSAWIGAAVAVLIVIGLSINSAKLKKALYVGLAIIVVVAAASSFGLRHNVRFQNEVLHTQANSQVKSTSDEGHLTALKIGLHDILRQPFGRGVGTAGPASVYNKPHATRLAENYFIQIGQETGWLGLAIFVMINLLTAKLLWRGRREPLGLCLLATLSGIILVNFLSHAWTDPTLAYIWWGLAGVALAPQFTDRLARPLRAKSKTRLKIEPS